MKFKVLTLSSLAAVTFCIALAVPIRVAAQEPQTTAQRPRYILKDLGTLGGPSSFFPSQPITRFLNNRGIVVGVADTPGIDPFAPNCASPDCHITHAFEWRNGVLTDLGTLPGGFNSGAGWINDKGVIMGGSDNGSVDPLTGLPESRGVIWKDGKMFNMGTLGGAFTDPNGMNNLAQVTGIAQNTIPDPFSMLGAGTQTRAFLWEDGRMRDLGTLGGPDAWGAFINERGQIAGWSYTNATPNATTGIPTQHPFVWEKGVMHDLGTLGGTLAVAGSFSGSGGGAINEVNQVIGSSTLAGDQTVHPFLFERATIRDLGTLGGANGEAYWINNAGDIVGRADFSPASTNHHAFLWRHGVMKDLGILDPASPCSTALEVNAMGQIIGDTGVCGIGGGPPFLWENGGPMRDLNSLVHLPSSGMIVTEARYINDRGEIAATGQLPNGDEHDIVLIPCILEPADSKGCEADAGTVIAETRAPAVSKVPAARRYPMRRPALWSHN